MLVPHSYEILLYLYHTSCWGLMFTGIHCFQPSSISWAYCKYWIKVTHQKQNTFLGILLFLLEQSLFYGLKFFPYSFNKIKYWWSGSQWFKNILILHLHIMMLNCFWRVFADWLITAWRLFESLSQRDEDWML